MVQEALASNIQGNSWVCQGSSWRSWSGLWGDPPLSDMVHASCNTHKTVAYHIFIPVPSSLHHYTTDEVNDLSSLFRYPGSHVSMSGVQLEVMRWSVGWSKPLRHGTWLIWHSWNIGIEYLYLCHHPCTTTCPMMKSMVRDLGSSNTQGNSWVCLGCSGRPYHGLWGDPPLSDVVHASYCTHEAVAYHINTGIITLRPLPLHHWWGPLFKLFVPIFRVTAEYVWGVVGGHVLVC